MGYIDVELYKRFFIPCIPETEGNIPVEINNSFPIENAVPDVPEQPGPGTSTDVVPVTENVPSNDERPQNEFIEILGEDPSTAVTYGPEIHKEIASRFTHICTSGLDKTNRKLLIEKHKVPGNCINISAPRLNAEIKAALSDSVVKRDKAIEYRQHQMAAAISSLGSIMSNLLINKCDNNALMRDLMDLGRLLCDIQHSQSTARRNLALNFVKKNLKDHLDLTKIDSYLFGENLAETLKTAKAVSKSSSDLKVEQQKQVKPAPTRHNLNWKAGTSARRQPTGQAPRHQQSAAPRAPPPRQAAQTYSRHSKQSRRQ